MVNAGTEPASPLDETVLAQLVADLDAATATRLVAGFVEEMMARTERITDAAAGGNADELHYEAHALKSSAGTYGAREIAQAACEIEACCRSGDMAGAARRAGRLPAQAGRAEQAFGAWRAGLGTGGRHRGG